MKKLFYLIMVIFVLALAGNCDRNGKCIDDALTLADALMTDHPDSALAILKAIDTTGISHSRLARYALLLTKAEDKNYLIPTNDSLIKIAKDYYCGHGNREEIEALYLFAHVLYNRDSIKESLPHASLAYKLATETNNLFYMGMSARLLSDIYKFLYIFADQKQYAVFAKDAFLKFEKKEKIINKYSAFMDNMIADAMYNNGEYEDCLSVCENVDSAAMQRESALRHYIWITKADAYNMLSHPDSSIMIYDTLVNDGYEMEGCNWTRLSLYHYNAGDKIRSRIALDSAKNNAKYAQDSLYIAYLEYLLASEDNDKKSLTSLRSYNRSVINTANDVISNSPLRGMTDSYFKRDEKYRNELRRQKILYGFSLFLTVTIMIMIGIWLTKRIRIKKREIILANKKAEDLENQIALLTHERESLEVHISNIKNVNKLNTKEQIQIYSSFLKKFDKYCSLIFLIPEKEKIANRFIKDAIDSLSSENMLNEIDKIIDFNSSGFLEIIKLNFPKMRQSRLRLIRYLYAGFSVETIMILLKIENRNSLDVSKSNLKKSIMEKNGWVETNCRIVLRKLHFK